MLQAILQIVSNISQYKLQIKNNILLQLWYTVTIYVVGFFWFLVEWYFTLKHEINGVLFCMKENFIYRENGWKITYE